MKKVYRVTQVLLAILFIAICIAYGNSTTAVNVIGVIGIVVSLFYIYIYRKIKRDYVQNRHVEEISG